MSFNTGLYDSRPTGASTMSRRVYLFAIGFYTAMFIVVAAIGASFSYGWGMTNSYAVFGLVIGCLVVSIGGAYLAHSNDSPTVSIVGGCICAGAMGLMMGPVVALYEAVSVVQALMLSAGVVLVTGFIGAVLPADLSAWGAPLFSLLLGAIFIQFGGILLSTVGVDMGLAFTVIDWAVLILFTAIMVYDLNRAQKLDKTHNNAIDVAVNVFLNFANIFIRILSLMGKRK